MNNIIKHNSPLCTNRFETSFTGDASDIQLTDDDEDKKCSMAEDDLLVINQLDQE